MKTIVRDQAIRENRAGFAIGLGFLVAMLTCYPFDSYCQLETLSANSDDKSLASMIRYANPREYDIEYIFELYPDFNKIDRGKDLKLWIAAPREWDSQKNVRFVSILPSPDSIYIDKEFGNKLVFWDFGRYPVESFYRVRIRVRFESYEISSWISADLVGPYDKTNKEYALYTRSTHTINITPKVNEFAREAIGDEVNPYLQAARIFDFVRERVRYKIVERERGRGIAALCDYPLIEKEKGVEYYEGSCSQFCALFVAMCRSAGIPSRSVFGFIGEKIFKKEEELVRPVFPFEKELSPEGLSGAQHYGVMGPHMWAEFYLQGVGWVPVDPTAGMFGYLYGVTAIMGKGRDIQLGPRAPQNGDEGYGSQWQLIHDGRVDFPLYGVFNIARIQTAKVKIIHCSERKQIVEELYREALEKDVENAKKHFWGLKEQFPDEYDFSREQLVMLGKRFRIEKRYEEAIDTYTWVTELYPEWWGGYHGLAEVQGIVGMKEYAIAGYGKSLELNPTKSHAKIVTELLKELIKP